MVAVTFFSLVANETIYGTWGIWIELGSSSEQMSRDLAQNRREISLVPVLNYIIHVGTVKINGTDHLIDDRNTAILRCSNVWFPADYLCVVHLFNIYNSSLIHQRVSYKLNYSIILPQRVLVHFWMMCPAISISRHPARHITVAWPFRLPQEHLMAQANAFARTQS